eukprot:592236-Pyramimonas_sp.AAC.1
MHARALFNAPRTHRNFQTYSGLENPPGLQGKCISECRFKITLVSIDLGKIVGNYVKVQYLYPRCRICGAFGTDIGGLVL